MNGIEEFVRMPTCGHRPGLRLAVADNARREQTWIVEHRAISMGQSIAELASFMNRSGRFRRSMTWDATRKRKLSEEPFHSRVVLRNVGVKFGEASLQIGLRPNREPAMAR